MLYGCALAIAIAFHFHPIYLAIAGMMAVLARVAIVQARKGRMHARAARYP